MSPTAEVTLCDLKTIAKTTTKYNIVLDSH